MEKNLGLSSKKKEIEKFWSKMPGKIKIIQKKKNFQKCIAFLMN